MNRLMGIFIFGVLLLFLFAPLSPAIHRMAGEFDWAVRLLDRVWRQIGDPGRAAKV